MSTDPLDKFCDRLAEEVDKFTASSCRLDGFRTKLQEAFDDVHDGFINSMRDNLSETISQWVTDHVDRIIAAMLNGDQEELKRQLRVYGEDEAQGRDGKHHFEYSRGRTAPQIFEWGGLKLRKAIIDQFPDLLKNERIKDLEDQIKALTAENVKTDGQRIQEHNRNHSLRHANNQLRQQLEAMGVKTEESIDG